MARKGIIRSFLPSLLLGTLCLFSPLVAAKNIIFDLGGIILETDSAYATEHMGGKCKLGTCIFSNLLHFFNPFTFKHRLKNCFFDTMAYATPDTETPANWLGAQPLSDGCVIPPVMCSWLSGTASNKDCLNYTLQAIEDNPGLFNSTSEQQIIKKIAELTFDPQIFADSRMMIHAGYNIVCACDEAAHKKGRRLFGLGRRKHQLFILSNWDRESFRVLRNSDRQLFPNDPDNDETFKEFFDRFDGILISGNCGTMKPYKHMYHTLLRGYGLKPNECIFIDDQEENIEAARTCFNEQPDEEHARCIHCPNLKQNPKAERMVVKCLQGLQVL